jgi:hypothetical protein
MANGNENSNGANGNGGRTFLGIPLTPENALKFAGLVFALGMLYQRINGMEAQMRAEFISNRQVIEERLNSVNLRLDIFDRAIGRLEANGR